MKGAIAIFAKTIGLSPVKTRLAATIGKKKAEEFYKLSVDAIEEIVMHTVTLTDHEIVPIWAIAEKEGGNHDRWQSFLTIWTGEGGLGERLHHVYSTLLKDYDYVVLIGTDSPQLTPDLLCDAAQFFKDNKETFVVGPCFDGGFYLFGGSEPIKKSIWVDTIYSRSDTLSSLLSNFEPKKYYTLQNEQDVDIAEDLTVLFRNLKSNSFLPMQERVLNWIETNF